MKKTIFVPSVFFEETLATSPTDGKKQLEPLKTFAKSNAFPVHILENQAKENVPEVHHHEDDLWICISGETQFTVGGTLIGGKEKVRADGTVDTNEVLGTSIEGGESYTLKAGDMLYIPAGEPHMHSATGTVRLYIIKLPKAPEKN